MSRVQLIQFRKGTAAQWTAANPTLANGEPGWESDTKKVKIGDGSTAWNSLAYIGASGNVPTSRTLTAGSGLSGGGDLSANRTFDVNVDGSSLEISSDALRVKALGITPAMLANDSGMAAAVEIADAGGYFTGTDVEAALQEIGAGGIGGGGSSFGVEVPSGTVNGSNDTFTLSAPPDPSADLLLWKNGLLMKQGLDYTLASDTITFDAAQVPQTGDILLAAIPTSAGGGGGSGTELDYAERTSDLTVTATSDATADTVVSGNAVTYDGSTRICIEVYVSACEISTNQGVLLNIYDGSTDLGRVCNVAPKASTGSAVNAAYGRLFLTPSSGSHTFHLKAWKTAGTATLYASAGGAASYLPAFIRITEA